LKEEALDRTMWRARFGRGFVWPVVRQTTKLMNTKMKNATECLMSSNLHTGVKHGQRGNFCFNVHFNNKVVPTHAIKFYGRPKVWLHSFLTSAPDLMARFTNPAAFIFCHRAPKTIWQKAKWTQSLSRRLRRKEESLALVRNRTNTYWATPGRYWYQVTS
jgi:superoxide dismutase